MFRSILASVLTTVAMINVPNAQADFQVFSWSTTAQKWQMTQTYKVKAQADSAVATAKSLGLHLIVVDTSNPPAATQPATPAPVKKAQTPVSQAPTYQAPAKTQAQPQVKPATPKLYVLQTSIKGSNAWRTVMELPDLQRLQAQAMDYQKSGFDVRILDKASVAPSPYKMDPVPANIPLIGTWDIHVNSGGIGQDFTMEITHLNGNTFTFLIPYHGQGQGEFNAKTGTVRFHHNGQAYTGNVRRSANGGWHMGGFISTSDWAATDWTGKRQ